MAKNFVDITDITDNKVIKDILTQIGPKTISPPPSLENDIENYIFPLPTIRQNLLATHPFDFVLSLLHLVQFPLCL